jgi:hypothetical protein
MSAVVASPSGARSLARLEQRRPGYLPGNWAPEPGTAAAALLEIVAHLAGLVGEGLERTPEAQRIGFLDAMGIDLLPPSAARAPLVFQLAASAPIDVAAPEGTAVAAEIAPPLPATLGGPPSPAPAAAAEPLLFATEQAISLARAPLAAVQTLNPAADEFTDHPEPASPFVLFGDAEQIPHELYLGHDTMFEISGAAEISVQVGVSRPRGGDGVVAGVELRWEYLTADGWVPFGPVIDQTRGLALDGEILLRKVCGPPLERGTVDGIECYWIRARAVAPLALAGQPDAPAPPSIDTLRIAVSLIEEDLPLDAALTDGVPVDVTKDFLPFGAEPELGNAFLVACDDAFKREGARVGLRIEPTTANQVQPAENRTLTWEYSIGDRRWQQFLQGNEEQFEAGATRTQSLGRPPDWVPAAVDGDERRWLRVRISAGNYGGPTVYTPTGPQNQPKPPRLTRMTASYAYATRPEPPDHVKSRNRFTFADHSTAVRSGRASFAPFAPVAERQPAVYLGFGERLPVGLVSLFVDVPAGTEAGGAPPASPFIWEYRSPSGWAELAVLDATGGWRARGLIQFIGPPDLVADAGPAGPLYWIRARLRTGTGSPEELPLSGLYLNAVWASHRTDVTGEACGQADGTASQLVALHNGGVLGDARVEVQEWRGTSREWESRFREVPADRLRYDRDARDAVRGVWVEWEERAYLFGSGPFDRHYTLDRANGVVRFGDGTSGAMPPPGAAIVASYRYGGGPQGNVAADTIVQPYDPVPYLETVTNPSPAAGGAAGEVAATGRGAGVRGPHALRHRGRAVAASDFEWLARDASSEVALARCLPVTGPEGVPATGWVTLIIAPVGEEPEPQPSVELLQRVRAHIAACAPVAVAGRVRVMGPAYQHVSVTAEVAVADVGDAAAIESAIRARLGAFLHPIAGGWQFGEAVRLSHVAALIEGVPGVAYAGRLLLGSEGAVAGERVPIAADRLPASGRHLLKLAPED